TVKLQQDTRYPWDGAVKLTVTPLKSSKFNLNLRIPGWARDEAVPSDLYAFVNKAGEPATIKVNGKSVPLKLDKGYVTLQRTWKQGDVVELNIPMPVRRIIANEQVSEDRNKVALQRGPLVYCVEWPEVKDGHVVNLVLPDESPVTAEFRPDL